MTVADGPVVGGGIRPGDQQSGSRGQSACLDLHGGGGHRCSGVDIHDLAGQVCPVRVDLLELRQCGGNLSDRQVGGLDGLGVPLDPAAGVDLDGTVDRPQALAAQAHPRHGCHLAPQAAVRLIVPCLEEKVGEQEGILACSDEPLVGGDGCGLSAVTIQWDDGDRSLATSPGEEVLGGLDGQGAVGQGLAQD